MRAAILFKWGIESLLLLAFGFAPATACTIASTTERVCPSRPPRVGEPFGRPEFMRTVKENKESSFNVECLSKEFITLPEHSPAHSIALLGAPEAVVRNIGVAALGLETDLSAPALDALVARFHDDIDERVREDALQILIKKVKTSQMSERQLGEFESAIRSRPLNHSSRWALVALAETHRPSLERLLAQLGAADGDHRREAATLLAAMRPIPMLVSTALCKASNDSDPHVAGMALTGLMISRHACASRRAAVLLTRPRVGMPWNLCGNDPFNLVDTWAISAMALVAGGTDPMRPLLQALLRMDIQSDDFLLLVVREVGWEKIEARDAALAAEVLVKSRSAILRNESQHSSPTLSPFDSVGNHVLVAMTERMASQTDPTDYLAAIKLIQPHRWTDLSAAERARIDKALSRMKISKNTALRKAGERTAELTRGGIEIR